MLADRRREEDEGREKRGKRKRVERER